MVEYGEFGPTRYANVLRLFRTRSLAVIESLNNGGTEFDVFKVLPLIVMSTWLGRVDYGSEILYMYKISEP